MAGIKEVAARAGVSISTVSYVMSGKRSVSARTRTRVMQAARDLGYIPRSGGRQARTGVIALSSPMDEGTAYGDWSPFFFGVARRSHLRGYDLMVLMGQGTAEELVGLSDSGQVDGVLLMDVTVDDPRIRAAVGSRVPMVSIGCPDRLDGIYAVDLDFEQMGRLAIRHLAGAGHTHVLFLGANPAAYEEGVNFLVRTRASVRSSAALARMAVTEEYLSGEGAGPMGRLVGRALAADPGISAVLGQVGPMDMFNLERALAAAGRPVGAGMSVIQLGSFGKGAVLDPPLDEIPLRPYAACARAVDILVEMAEGKRSRPGRGTKELIPVTYLDRGSVRRPHRAGVCRNPSK
ncbi:LacI family DNA-binding transcriptional regulator [Bifidobacterium favimelis]|uniref:LacI family DNA-binding transcriptional regulator n=1 Tax=Bifidobacterium favimelis TaxID=3122979 RepID=A0ABU8ZPM7_9BIFI